MSALTWATDATFPSGPYAGVATKTEPSAGLKATGMEPGEKFGAQQFNWLISELAANVSDPLIYPYAHWDLRAASGTPTLQSVHAGTSTPVANMIVAVGTAASIQTSTNGVTWTARTAGGGYGFSLAGATSNATKFCLVGGSGGIQTSSDGVTWAAKTAAAAFGGSFLAVASNPSATGTQPDFIAVGASGTIQSSTDDGGTWNSETAGSAYASTFYSVAYDPTTALWCAVGANGEIQTAPNGNIPLTWTSRRASTEARGWVVPKPGGGFIVVFDAGTTCSVYTSADGTTYTAVTQVTAAPQPSTNAYHPVTVGPDERRVVIASDASVYDSDIDDLGTWTGRVITDDGTSYPLNGISCNGKSMVAVGTQTIAQSLRVA